MSLYQDRPGSFRQIRNSFLQSDGTRFREALSDEQIEQAARQEKLAFGAGKDDVAPQ